MTLLDAVPYATPAAYLAITCLILIGFGKVPVAVHAAGLVGGFAAHVALTGWVPALVSLGVGVFALLFCVYLARGVLTALGVFTISVSLATSPVGGWAGLGAGVLVAAIVGTVRTIRVAGVDRVAHLTTSTAFAMGVTPGGFTRPNPQYLPQADDTAQIVQTEQDARRMRLLLPPYLLAGLVLAATAATIL